MTNLFHLRGDTKTDPKQPTVAHTEEVNSECMEAITVSYKKHPFVTYIFVKSISSD